MDTTFPKTILIEARDCLKSSDVNKIFEEASVVALDAEWPPESTHRHPAATLLQMAFWSKAYGTCVLLLDLIKLFEDGYEGEESEGGEIVVEKLREVFKRKDVLKLGWSFANDFRALNRTFKLCKSCRGNISEIQSIIDLNSLHRFFLHGKFPGIRVALEQSLSGVLQAQFNKPLDKTQQCSAWGERPLNHEQMIYAASDACCLLGLFDEYISSTPLLNRPQSLDISPDRLDSTREYVNESNSCDAVTNDEPSSAATDMCRCTIPLSDKLHTIEISNEDNVHPATKRSCSLHWNEESICHIKERWGEHWELVTHTGSSGTGRHIRRSGGLTAQAKELLGRKLNFKSKSSRLNGGSKISMQLLQGFPNHVPWMDSNRKIIEKPRFLADVMLQGAARQLRLWGFDAEHIETVGKNQRHMVHRQLVTQAEKEGRVILTRDMVFMQRRLSDQAYFVQANDKQTQLEEIVKVFGLHVDKDTLLSRCARCNGEFISHPFQGKDLPPDCGVPTEVAERPGIEFWVCSRCGSAYWQGNMYARAMERLSEKLEKLQVA